MELTENEKRLLNTVMDWIREYQQRITSDEWLTALTIDFLKKAEINGGFEKVTVEFYPNEKVKEVNIYSHDWEGYSVLYNEDGNETGIGLFHEDPMNMYWDAMFKLIDYFADTNASHLSTEEVRELFEIAESMKTPRLSDEEMKKIEKVGFLLD